MADSSIEQHRPVFRGWRDETVLIALGLGLGWIAIIAVALAVDYVEYCTGYPIVDCGPMSIQDFGWMLLGWVILGLLPSVVLITLVYHSERRRHEIPRS